MYTDLQTLYFIVCAQTWYIIVTFDVKAHLQFTLYGIFTTQETNKQLLHKYRGRHFIRSKLTESFVVSLSAVSYFSTFARASERDIFAIFFYDGRKIFVDFSLK